MKLQTAYSTNEIAPLLPANYRLAKLRVILVPSVPADFLPGNPPGFLEKDLDFQSPLPAASRVESFRSVL
jgi:hypothetical protein